MATKFSNYAGSMLVTEDLQHIRCGGCGLNYAVPDGWLSQKKEDHTGFFCPNGCRRIYKKDPDEVVKLERKVAQLTAQADQLNASLRSARICAEHAERRVSAQKGQVTKIKNRVAKGVCPCCNRTFENLARHMETKHPDFAHVDPEAKP